MFTRSALLKNCARRSRRAFTLLETMFASGIFILAFVMVASIFVFCLRSFTAMSNYVILDIENRQAMDKLTREIRQARRVKDYTIDPPSLTIVGDDGNGGAPLITYTFNPENKTMQRAVNDAAPRTMLNNCEILNFSLSQRNPKDGAYDLYPIAVGSWEDTVKVVELTWKTRLGVGGTVLTNSENIQTARIVIRKQEE